jgi:hypothetical protein
MTIHTASRSAITPHKDTSGKMLKYVPTGGDFFLTSPDVDDKLYWVPIEVPAVKWEKRFVDIIDAQIQADPFSGIYRYIFVPETHHVYLYMKNSAKVKAWLNSAAAGAGFRKKEIGTKETTGRSPLEAEEVAALANSLEGEIPYKSRANIKRCFAGGQIIERAQNAAKQIKEEHILMTEYATAIIKDLDFSGEDIKDIIWTFTIDTGYVYGLLSAEQMQRKLSGVRQLAGQESSNKLSLNDIDFLIEPIMQTISKQLTAVEGLLNLETIARYIDVMQNKVLDMVSATPLGDIKELGQKSYEVEADSPEFAKEQKDYVEKNISPQEYEKLLKSKKKTETKQSFLQFRNIDELLKSAAEEEIQAETPVELTESPEKAIPQETSPVSVEAPKKETVSYKIESHKLRIVRNDLLVLDVVIDINGVKKKETIKLEGAHLIDILTKKGFDLLFKEATDIINAYYGKAPCIDTSKDVVYDLGKEGIQSTSEELEMPAELLSKKIFTTVYEIDTNALIALNK